MKCSSLRRGFLGMVSATSIPCFLASCLLDDVDLSKKACPCPSPDWECGPENRCVPRGESGVASSTGSVTSGTGGSGGAAENLLFNGDFENGCAVSWGSNGTVEDETTLVRNGERACRVCVEDPMEFSLFLNALAQAEVDAEPGTQISMEAWVHAVDGEVGFAIGLRGNVLDENSAFVTEFRGSEVPIEAKWKPIDVAFEVPALGVKVSPFVIATSAKCFLVDDVSVTKP